MSIADDGVTGVAGNGDARAAAQAQAAAEEAPSAAAAAASGRRARRRLPERTKRLLFIIVGVFVLVGSVAGFYFTSDAFDQRIPVLVANRHIDAGEPITAADLGSDLVVTGSVPFVPFTADALSVFDGTVASQMIPVGSLMRYDMVVEATDVLGGVGLEVIVPLDLSLASEEVAEGSGVLLIDPGAEPADGDEGRPRSVVRQFRLTGFDGSQMRLVLPPEEWAEWEALLEDVGGTLMAVDLAPGVDEAETMSRLDAVWQAQWQEAVDEVAAALAAAQAAPRAGPGELEVIVQLDASLAPSGVAEGDLVLLVDPGVEPRGNDPGRPRAVIGTLVLSNFADGAMQMFVGPEDWLYWRTLADDLGAAPMVLPVAEGTDIDDFTERLNAQWAAAWEASAVRSSEER